MFAIFGSNGNLGSAFRTYFDSCGERYVCFDRVGTSEFCRESGRGNAIEKIHTMISCVAIPSERRSLAAPMNASIANLSIPNQLAWLAHVNCKHFVSFSSHAVHRGVSEQKYYKDSDQPDPDTFYGFLKGEHERFVLGLPSNSALKSIIRLPSLFEADISNRSEDSMSLLDRLSFQIGRGQRIRVDSDWFDSPVRYNVIPKLSINTLKSVTRESRVFNIASKPMTLLEFLATRVENFKLKIDAVSLFSGGKRYRLLEPSAGFYVE